MARITYRSDADIFSDARRALDARPSVPQDVRVHVDQGTVTLTGSVRCRGRGLMRKPSYGRSTAFSGS